MENNKILNTKNIKFHINKNIYIYGWINNIRVFTKKEIIFIELRDLYGNIQVFIKKKNLYNNNFYEIKKYKIEFCIQVEGIVNNRKENNINSKNLYNSNIEILCKNIFLLNKSEMLPINLNKDFSDINKIKYRYLYIRKNKNISDNIIKKSELIYEINKFMNKNKFIYIETPVITKKISEGSRGFDIFKINKIKYSLAQSPQIFKQILMMSGFNKYYQISRCFRYEDVRKNRQFEFTQLDIESSFINKSYIINLSEKLIKYLWNKIKNIKINNIKSISYYDSIRQYGTDKPDLRNYIKILDLKKDIAKEIKFNSDLYIINIIYEHINYVKNFLEINKIILTYEIVNSNDLLNIIIRLNKNINRNKLHNKILEIKNINIIKSDIFFITKDCKIKNIIHNFRIFISNKIKLEESITPVWIEKFPMFKLINNKIKCVNHPFAKPDTENINYIINNMFKINSESYDLVINGMELASGTERINNYKLQKIIFDILKISKYKQKKEFGFFINALKYGTPPHAGIGFGLDRLFMSLHNIEDIKDTISFPKTNNLFDITTL